MNMQKYPQVQQAPREAAMALFFAALFSYPAAVFTVLLILVLVYWLMVIIGIVDIDSADAGLGLDADAGAAEIEAGVEVETGDAGADGGGEANGVHPGGLGGILAALGLKDIPVTIIFSLIILCAWTIACLVNMRLLPPASPRVFKLLAGTGVLAGSLLAGIVISSVVLRPLRRFFVSHHAVSKGGFAGSVCTVVTGTVDGSFGRAEIAARGTSINIQVWAETPNEFKKGSTGIIVEYDAERDRYLIVPEDLYRKPLT
jgi:hypothetical protein